MWYQESNWLYYRNDRARVGISDSAPPGGKRWIGWGPEQSQPMQRNLRSDRSEWKTSERRFGSALAAQKAVDQSFPLQLGLKLDG